MSNLEKSKLQEIEIRCDTITKSGFKNLQLCSDLGSLCSLYRVYRRNGCADTISDSSDSFAYHAQSKEETIKERQTNM